MALTVYNPKQVGVEVWFPSGNDITYSLSSTNSSKNGFYYLIDVYIGTNKVVTLRKYPITSTTYVNIRDIIDSYIESPFVGTYTSGSINWRVYSALNGFKNDFVPFHIVVTEYYEGATHESITTIDLFAWNSAAQLKDEKAGTQTFERNFIFDTQSTIYKGRPMGFHNVITVSPSAMFTGQGYLKEIYKNSAYHVARGMKNNMSIFCGYSVTRNTEVQYVICFGMDSDGKVIKKATKAIANTDNNINRHWVSFAFNGGLETSWDNTYKNGGGTFTDMSDCTYIYYCFSKTTTGSLSYEQTTSNGILLRVCDVPESWGICYKSYEGGWNIIQCNRRATETTDIQTITKENPNPVSAYWGASTRLISAVYVQAQGKYLLHTDWITEAVNEDIKDMLQSPLLYIQHLKDGNTEYIPVTLADANYTTKQINDVNLFNYSFELVESFYKNTIRQ